MHCYLALFRSGHRLWRVSTPDSTPSFYFGTAVCISAPKMSELDTQCNLEMAFVQMNQFFCPFVCSLSIHPSDRQQGLSPGFELGFDH